MHYGTCWRRLAHRKVIICAVQSVKWAFYVMSQSHKLLLLLFYIVSFRTQITREPNEMELWFFILKVTLYMLNKWFSSQFVTLFRNKVIDKRSYHIINSTLGLWHGTPPHTHSNVYMLHSTRTVVNCVFVCIWRNTSTTHTNVQILEPGGDDHVMSSWSSSMICNSVLWTAQGSLYVYCKVYPLVAGYYYYYYFQYLLSKVTCWYDTAIALIENCAKLLLSNIVTKSKIAIGEYCEFR